jgi:serine protease inhibitor ecotin
LKKSGPASTAVTCAALKSKIEESKFVIAYFGEEGTPLYTDAHIAYANSEDNIQFFHKN